MTLKEILRGVALHGALPEQVAGLPVESLEYDSRRVGERCLFFAFQGYRADGRNYAAEAVRRGAVAVASELAPSGELAAPWIRVEHEREALALAARNLYGPLDERLVLTGITGTNGKTTAAWLVDSILSAAGKTTALLGTIQYRVAGEVRPAPNTTPESLDLYRILAELHARGGSHVTMEVSSHALALARVYGLRFHCAVFTNFSRDHLDFHKTMEAYFAAKQILFAGSGAPPPRWACVNMDDPQFPYLRVAPDSRLLRFGMGPQADVRATRFTAASDGLRFDLHLPDRTYAVRSPLAGQINVYNILAAACVGLSCGLDGETILAGVERCRAVPGRMERVDEGQPFTVVVDYAHTDDALRNAIRAARGLSPRRVITVFGCGGDRDRTKRPLMGAAAAELSDLVVLTSDNPRSEDPLAIMNDAMVGIRRHDTAFIAEPDRTAAIRRALEEAGPGDLVLVAGKGHETYQILKDRTIHFDDREVVSQLLQGFGYGRKPA
ncbi:MAG: UDP-N-acetylmuramoyl-L-alanyl-D-glutamate--2,6-diaminopimelate ligase [Bryobacterales bacterium]|nr:UDP-N-acetylmuramoyl-L-alanyl-D-glutamate--2,6-diaminopimelate ligase [Bryobacterales bacterium]